MGFFYRNTIIAHFIRRLRIMKAFAQALEAMTTPRHNGADSRDVLDRAISERLPSANGNSRRSPKLIAK